jgi:hypothetical protein
LFLFVGGIVFLPGWHHIVAVQTGRMLDGLLRADDVSMKTTGWRREHPSRTAAGAHFIGLRTNRAQAASGERAPRPVP